MSNQSVADACASAPFPVPVPVSVPDPATARQELPGPLWRRYEYGSLSRSEFWRELERLWGLDDVARLLEGRVAA